jgi:hypothetical protein
VFSCGIGLPLASNGFFGIHSRLNNDVPSIPFEGTVPIKAGVGAFQTSPYAAFADGLNGLVLAEFFAGFQFHFDVTGSN